MAGVKLQLRPSSLTTLRMASTAKVDLHTSTVTMRLSAPKRTRSSSMVSKLTSHITAQRRIPTKSARFSTIMLEVRQTRAALTSFASALWQMLCKDSARVLSELRFMPRQCVRKSSSTPAQSATRLIEKTCVRREMNVELAPIPTNGDSQLISNSMSHTGPTFRMILPTTVCRSSSPLVTST